MAHSTSRIGRRLLPQVLDEVASQFPNRIYGEYPPPDFQTYGYRTLTWAQVAHAVNKTAFWLDQKLGPASDFETFAYTGANDFRYAFLLLAAMKTGRKMLVPHPRVSGETRLSLLKQTKCNFWICSLERMFELGYLQDERLGMKIVTMPSLEHFLEGETEHYPYAKTFEEAAADPAWITHDPASVGIPKVYIKTNDMATSIDLIQTLSKDGDPSISTDGIPGSRYLSTIPPHETLGLIGMVHMPILWQSTAILPPASSITDLDLSSLVHILRIVQIDGGFYHPAVLRQICGNDSAQTLIRQHEYILFDGGPLDTTVGDALCRSTLILPLVNHLDFGIIPSYEKPGDQWKYLTFHPASGWSMEPRSDGLYELVVARGTAHDAFQSFFDKEPDLEVFRTKKLFSKYAMDRWFYEGQSDHLFTKSSTTTLLSPEVVLEAEEDDLDDSSRQFAQKPPASIITAAATPTATNKPEKLRSFSRKLKSRLKVS